MAPPIKVTLVGVGGLKVYINCSLLRHIANYWIISEVQLRRRRLELYKSNLSHIFELLVLLPEPVVVRFERVRPDKLVEADRILVPEDLVWIIQRPELV